MHYTYILKSKIDGSFYRGSTENLRKRLLAHNQHIVKSTKSKAPYFVAWYCAFPTKAKARAFEKYLKTGSGIAFAKKHLET